MVGHGGEERRRILLPGKTQGGADPLLGEGSLEGRGALVEEAHAVAQGSICQAGEEAAGAGIQVDVLLVGDIVEPPGDVLGQKPPEGKPLAAGEDGGGHLLKLRGGQDEDQMLRRLLDDLQKGVEGRHGEHVHLVDDIDPAGDLRGGVDRVVPEDAHLVDAVVGCRVDLQNIQAASRIDGAAGSAVAAGASVLEVGAVEGFGQDLGAGGLAGASRAGEEVGVADFSGFELGSQRLGDSCLPHHVVKGLGSIFPVKRLVHPAPPLQGNLSLYYTQNQPGNKAWESKGRPGGRPEPHSTSSGSAGVRVSRCSAVSPKRRSSSERFSSSRFKPDFKSSARAAMSSPVCW